MTAPQFSHEPHSACWAVILVPEQKLVYFSANGSQDRNCSHWEYIYVYIWIEQWETVFCLKHKQLTLCASVPNKCWFTAFLFFLSFSQTAACFFSGSLQLLSSVMGRTTLFSWGTKLNGRRLPSCLCLLVLAHHFLQSMRRALTLTVKSSKVTAWSSDFSEALKS